MTIFSLTLFGTDDPWQRLSSVGWMAAESVFNIMPPVTCMDYVGDIITWLIYKVIFSS
jgi:hypothetical protein